MRLAARKAVHDLRRIRAGEKGGGVLATLISIRSMGSTDQVRNWYDTDSINVSQDICNTILFV